MKTMRLALVQVCPEPGQLKENAEKMMRCYRQAVNASADLVLFPECSLTGYSTQLAETIAVSSDLELLAQIRKVCRAEQTAICFGYVERTENTLYLTQELVTRDAGICYRKTHLGTREREVFSAGCDFPVISIPVRNLAAPSDPFEKTGQDREQITTTSHVAAGIQLCWESHIPEISSAQRSNGAQLLLVPYASPMSGEVCRQNWQVHLPARASDNGAFLAACNLLFPKDGLRGGGMAVYDFKGRCLAESFSDEEQMLVCDLEGRLPREYPDGDMHNISYFDRKRKDLFS